jgi:hypothetical protein
LQGGGLVRSAGGWAAVGALRRGREAPRGDEPKNLTAKIAKIAKTRQLSSSQEGIRTKTFRVVPPISSALAL